MDTLTILLVAGMILLVTNIVSFSLMAYDKRCAGKGKWRVPEKGLFLATGLFGGLGGVLGMQLLRHKTKHWYFQIFFPLMLVAQIILLVLAWFVWL